MKKIFRLVFSWFWSCILTLLLITAGQMLESLVNLISGPEDSFAAGIFETGMLYASFIGIWIVFILFMLAVKADRETLRHIGKVSRGNTLRFALAGAATGFAMNGLCALAAGLNGDIALHFDNFSLPAFVILLIAVFIQSGAEELACRVFLYRRILRAYKSPLLAVLVNSALFGALHLFNNGVSAVSIYNIVIIGILMSLVIYYWDSFRFVAWLHTAWNFTQNILLGLPNSGHVVPYSIFKLDAANARDTFFYNTAFGLEGTFYADIVLTVAALAVFFMGRKMTGKKLERPEAGTSAGA